MPKSEVFEDDVGDVLSMFGVGPKPTPSTPPPLKPSPPVGVVSTGPIIFHTLDQAVQFVQDNLEDGVSCPCCRQTCKLYRRNMNSIRAGGLVWLVGTYQASPRWVHVPKEGPQWLVSKGGEFSLLRHWGLIEQRPNDDTTKRTSGMWRPTDRGVQFAHGQTRVRKTVFLFNNQIEGWSDDTISIHEALDKNFDYQQLTAGTP